jgi:hypothetical protein
VAALAASAFPCAPPGALAAITATETPPLPSALPPLSSADGPAPSSSLPPACPALPYFGLDIECGGGTYVRSLIDDLGTGAGSRAHMVRRRQVKLYTPKCKHRKRFKASSSAWNAVRGLHEPCDAECLCCEGMVLHACVAMRRCGLSARAAAPSASATACLSTCGPLRASAPTPCAVRTKRRRRSLAPTKPADLRLELMAKARVVCELGVPAALHHGIKPIAHCVIFAGVDTGNKSSQVKDYSPVYMKQERAKSGVTHRGNKGQHAAGCVLLRVCIRRPR